MNTLLNPPRALERAPAGRAWKLGRLSLQVTQSLCVRGGLGTGLEVGVLEVMLLNTCSEPGFGLVGICKPGPNLGVPKVPEAYSVGGRAECFRDQEATPREPSSSHLTGRVGLPKGIWFQLGSPPFWPPQDAWNWDEGTERPPPAPSLSALHLLAPSTGHSGCF